MPKRLESKTIQNSPTDIPPRMLDDVDHLIIKFMIEHPGCSHIQVAKFMNLSRHTIADRAKNPRFQMQVEELTKPAIKILKELQPIAALTLRKHLQAKVKDEHGNMVDDVATQTKIALELSKPNLQQSVRVEHAGDPDHPVVLKAVRELSDDDLRQIIDTKK